MITVVFAHKSSKYNISPNTNTLTPFFLENFLDYYNTCDEKMGFSGKLKYFKNVIIIVYCDCFVKIKILFLIIQREC